jgi:hypothetical protein
MINEKIFSWCGIVSSSIPSSCTLFLQISFLLDTRSRFCLREYVLDDVLVASTITFTGNSEMDLDNGRNDDLHRQCWMGIMCQRGRVLSF